MIKILFVAENKLDNVKFIEYYFLLENIIALREAKFY